MSRTPHFALHRLAFDGPAADAPAVPLASADAAEAAPPARRTPPLFPAVDVFLGAMVPKRWARRAVTRNAIKRQIYTVGGEAGPRLPLAGYVVRLRSGFDRKQFISATSDVLKLAVRQELQQLLGRVTAPAAAPTRAAA